MTTNISFTPSSFYNFETSSSSSQISSSFTDHSYELQPRQNWNLKSLLIILNSRENFKELMGLLDGQVAFQKMLTINHLHSMIWRMEHEIWKQKAKATMLFNDVLTMKKSQQLQMHFQKNHSGQARQVSPEPLPILPPFQSPSPPPSPVPIPGTPENLIDIDVGTRESPIKILDNPKLVIKQGDDESDEEFPFWGWTSPLVVNDWEGRVDWSAARCCENCGSISHGTWWCWEGLTYNSETGFWYTDKSEEIWLRRGAVLWFHQFFQFFFYSTCFTHLFLIVSWLIVSSIFHCFTLLFHIDWCYASKAALVNTQHSFHQLYAACRQYDSLVTALQCTALLYLYYLNP